MPSQAPPLTEISARSSTSVRLKWNFIPQAYVHGILTGYKLQYSLNESPRVWINVTTGSSTRQKTVTGLSKYTVYAFRVAGMTSKGTGVFSTESTERTWEDSELFKNMLKYVSFLNPSDTSGGAKVFPK